ncbi:MAG: hypothetical protein QME64_09605, partial [bacterium]|nr:hypothetical protein [bacterium]
INGPATYTLQADTSDSATQITVANTWVYSVTGVWTDATGLGNNYAAAATFTRESTQSASSTQVTMTWLPLNSVTGVYTNSGGAGFNFYSAPGQSFTSGGLITLNTNTALPDVNIPIWVTYNGGTAASFVPATGVITLNGNPLPGASTPVWVTYLATNGAYGDYAYLSEAAADFNTTANTGNWTIEILTSFNQPYNCAFGNEVLSGSTITIKPAAGIQPTITFTTTADNPGPSGYILIGANTNAAAGWEASTAFQVRNFIIDGSNSGSTTRDLTLTNTAVTHTFPTFVMVIGKCDGVTVKNANLINWGTGSNAGGVRFCQRSTNVAPASSQLLTPQNGTVQNCYIQTTSGSLFNYAVWFNQSGPGWVGSGQNNMLIENCQLYARTRPVMSFVVGNLTVRNNKIKGYSTGGYQSWGIWHLSANGQTGWTVDIYNNQFEELQNSVAAGNFGPTAIAPQAGDGTYNIYNNIIAGINLNASVATTVNYRAIWANAYSNYNIVYNSINMPMIPTLSLMTNPVYSHAIGLTSSNMSTKVVNISNNIIRVGQASLPAIYIADTTGLVSFTSDYNDIAVSGGASAGIFGFSNTTCLTLADWTTATGKDLNSQNVDPTATAPAAWVSATDLHWSAATSAYPLRAGTPIAVTTDIDGITRHGTLPWPGAVENNIAGVSIQPVPVELSRFETFIKP